MIHIDKVKLMDSGTVLFRAESREAAVAKVVRALKGAELEEYAPDAFLADFSDAFFYSVVRAVVSRCPMKVASPPASRRPIAADASSGPSLPKKPGAAWTGSRLTSPRSDEKLFGFQK